MIGLGMGIFAAGFAIAGYGWGQLRGCNAGFVAMIWPGSYKGCNADSGSNDASQGTGTAPTPENPNPKNPITAPPKGATGSKDTPFGGGQPVYTA